jgi:hypothetical protein
MIGDVDALAAVLEARHGLHSAEIADFFSAYHQGYGDIARAWAWATVAEMVRLRQRTRLSLRGGEDAV